MVRRFSLIAFLLTATALSAEQATYQGVWHSDTNPSVTTAPLGLQQFLSSGEDLANQGFRAIDVETRMVNGQRVYAGLWSTGIGGTAFTGPFGAIDMREEIEARLQQNMRIEDFEVFRTESGGRRYIALWRNGAGQQRLTGPMQFEAFKARGESLGEEGLRPVDIEVEEVNGVLLYHGLFRTGTGDAFLSPPLELSAFRVLRDAQVFAGLELADLERIEDDGETLYVGLWRTGNGESRLSSPRPFGEYFVFSQEQFNNGMESRDFELAVQVMPEEDDDPMPNPPGTIAPEDFPENPPEIELVGGNTLRVIWGQVDDAPIKIELPRDNLPDWLPFNGEDVVLPDTFCGLNLRRAESLHWQTLDDNPLTQDPFLKVEDLQQEDEPLFLGGIEFSGPFGSCGGTQKDWKFEEPFTNSSIFEELPNLSLVVQLEGSGPNPDTGGQIRFMADGAPSGKFIDVDKLFKDNSKKKLEDIMKVFKETFEDPDTPNPDLDYCEAVGDYWTTVCTQFPGGCPDDFPALPDC